MDWLPTYWLYVAVVICIVILLALFGRRGENAHGAGGCCSGMESGKQEGNASAPQGHRH